ncbi:MAG: 4Fe-4S dicluster domain-containing protein [Planctomycetota bacterium]|jgi:formate dehydrogenase iron-sulfur subunit
MSGNQRAILYDITRCSGCFECVAACMNKQGFEGDPEEVKELSARAYTALGQIDEDYSYRMMCRHCVDPSCASVCPVSALEKTELGPVVYDAEKCMGCRYCMTACPFNVPRYEWDNPVPEVRKCDMCYDLQEQGLPTACTEACMNEATVCGTRDELIAEAWSRIEEDPDDYYHHVYGEHEVGGTSVLFLAPFPVEALGFDPSLGTEPLPHNTWRVLNKIPSIAVIAGASLLAFSWITQRREEVAMFEAREKASQNGSDRASRPERE